jgi:LPS export ABC transporter protein LptC
MKKLFLFLIIAINFTFCTKSPESQPAEEIKYKLEQPPDQTAMNISVDFLDSSKLKARLWAKVAKVYFARSETLLFDSIRVEFFSSRTGRRQSTLTCDSAKINDRTKDMYAFGKVLVVADSPKTIVRTTFLEWRNKTQRLYSNEFIEIITPDEEIRGYGFESDVNLTNYKIFKVSGVKK